MLVHSLCLVCLFFDQTFPDLNQESLLSLDCYSIQAKILQTVLNADTLRSLVHSHDDHVYVPKLFVSALKLELLDKPTPIYSRNVHYQHIPSQSVHTNKLHILTT